VTHLCRVALVLVALVLATAVLGAIAGRRSGLSARPEPSATEARLAGMVRGPAIDPEVRRARNPVPPGPAVLAEARAHFADHCASCHANDGSGNTQLGRRLYPRAPDMRLPATQELTDGELFHVIENGIRLTGMPGWGGEVSPEDSWKLVHLIRHLPKLTAEEMLEMERLNPKSPGEWQELQEDERFLEGAPARPGKGRHAH
jgi:mono/diheme cytochrome c family protein